VSRRIVPVVGAVLATMTVGGFLLGSFQVALVGLATLLLFLVAVSIDRRRAVDDPAWTRSPLTPHADGDIAGRRHATPREVSRALGLVESRELLYSPWFAVGVGLLIVIFVSFTMFTNTDLGNGAVWLQTVHLVPWFAHPLAGMTIIATFRAVTRSRRDDTDELFDGCPTGRDVRTAAQLRTVMVPLAAFGGFLAIYALALLTRWQHIHGPLTGGALAVIAASFVLLVGAVFLGTALGVWLPYAVVPIVAVFAIGAFSIGLRSDGDPGWNGLASLSTLGPEGDNPMLIALTSPWAYLAWIGALTTIVAVIAMSRHDRRRSVWLTGVGGVAAALVAGSLAVQPVEADDAAEVADLIMNPADHQTCTTTTNQAVSVCTLREYPELRSRVTESLLPLSEELKLFAGHVTVRQIFDGSIEGLPDAARAIVGGELPGLPGDEVGIGLGADRDALLADRLAVALWALDAPHTRGDDQQPVPIGREARGVLALWLAARGLDIDDAVTLATVDDEWETPDDAFERGYVWPSGCAPVVWSAQDLEAARAVMALPEQTVRDVLVDDPSRWRDPATTTDELLAALGLTAVGPFEMVLARPEDYC
jgi:hypothetical protein